MHSSEIKSDLHKHEYTIELLSFMIIWAIKSPQTYNRVLLYCMVILITRPPQSGSLWKLERVEYDVVILMGATFDGSLKDLSSMENL